jgi:arylsulfatase A-like enzyme/Tfp pilus assembly protein PilF
MVRLKVNVIAGREAKFLNLNHREPPTALEIGAPFCYYNPIMKKKIIPIIAVFIILAAAALWVIFKMKPGHFNRAAGFNLMVITLDTTRADRIGAYGCKEAITPNIDRLAREGMIFESCYAPVPLTFPSHCSLFTGKYPIGHHVRNNASYCLAGEEVTLAEVMKQKGYDTYAAIASFVLLAKFGLNQGFDIYDDSLGADNMLNSLDSEIPADQVYEKYSKWFTARDKNRQFFAWVHFFDPHIPYEPPAAYRGKFSDNFWGPYDGEIAYMDHYIGRIIQDLETEGILEQTLIVIAGDHGEAMGEHQEHGHGIFCYDENLKVPLIFFNQALFTTPKSIKKTVSLVDIMPSLLELYGEKPSAAIQGRGLLGALYGDEDEEKRSFYFESLYGKEEYGWAPLTGIIDGKYKYISLPGAELYNLHEDKEEKNNLFLEKNRLARELDAKLMKLIAGYSLPGAGSRRSLSEEDKKHLQSLGYVSSFSSKGDKPFDPKTGIQLKNKFIALQKDIDNGDIDKAEAELKRIVEENPEMKIPKYYTLMNSILNARGDVDGLIDSMKEAMEAFPQNEQFKLRLATFYMANRKDYDEAEKMCGEMLTENPQFTGAIILLSRIEQIRKNLPEALRYVEDALKIEPNNISLKLRYCRLLKQSKDFKRAEEAFNQCLADRSMMRNNEVRLEAAIFFTEIKKDETAFRLLTDLVEQEEGAAEAWNYLGILHFRKKNYQEAQEAYNRSIQLNPRVAKTFNNMGALYLTLFMQEKSSMEKRAKYHALALTAFDRALEINPRLVSALNGRASALTFTKRVRDALRDWQKAIEIKPDFVDAYFNLALTCLNLNLKSEARKYLTRCKDKCYDKLSPRDRDKLDRLIAQTGK